MADDAVRTALNQWLPEYHSSTQSLSPKQNKRA
jgi:hypothetical protein